MDLDAMPVFGGGDDDEGAAGDPGAGATGTEDAKRSKNNDYLGKISGEPRREPLRAASRRMFAVGSAAPPANCTSLPTTVQRGAEKPHAEVNAFSITRNFENVSRS